MMFIVTAAVALLVLIALIPPLRQRLVAGRAWMLTLPQIVVGLAALNYAWNCVGDPGPAWVAVLCLFATIVAFGELLSRALGDWPFPKSRCQAGRPSDRPGKETEQ